MINPKILIHTSTSIINALHQMDNVGLKMLLAFKDGKFVSILTIGDLQRAIIANPDMNISIEQILKPENKSYCNDRQSLDEIKREMIRIRCQLMPVLDDEGNLVEVYEWDKLFDVAQQAHNQEMINLPVVIMAGGKGTRLKPITNVIPKPLIPVGDKTILEEIMDQFEKIGCKKFYMSVNYKSDMMRFYLDQLDHKYLIEFFEETKPLGTIGSVSLLKGKITTPFFVSNCDIMIDQDYRDVYEYHKINQNDITIVTAVKSLKIPYGVIETSENGLMTGLKEKPEQTYMINTGVYLLNHELIDEIPEGEFIHITHLIQNIQARGGRVGCFPVSENAWKDMGDWNEYLKLINVK